MTWDRVRISVVLESSQVGRKGNCPHACQEPQYGTSSAGRISGIGWVLSPLNSSAQSAMASTLQASLASFGSKNWRARVSWVYRLACHLREI